MSRGCACELGLRLELGTVCVQLKVGWGKVSSSKKLGRLDACSESFRGPGYKYKWSLLGRVSVVCVWIEFLALGSIRCVVGSVQISIYIYLMLYIHTHSHTQTRSCNRLFALIFPALFAGTVKFEFN